MRYDLSYQWYRGFLLDNEIETGHDYLYCQLNRPPRHVRITGYAMTRAGGTPILFYWREVKADGSLAIEVSATLGLFKPLMKPTKLVLQRLNPLIALRGVFTAQLRRPKARAEECRC